MTLRAKSSWALLTALVAALGVAIGLTVRRHAVFYGVVSGYLAGGALATGILWLAGFGVARELSKAEWEASPRRLESRVSGEDLPDDTIATAASKVIDIPFEEKRGK